MRRGSVLDPGLSPPTEPDVVNLDSSLGHISTGSWRTDTLPLSES